MVVVVIVALDRVISAAFAAQKWSQELQSVMTVMKSPILVNCQGTDRI